MRHPYRTRGRVPIMSAGAALALALAVTTPMAAADASPSPAPSMPPPSDAPQAWPATELADAQAITSGLGRFVVVGSDGSFPPQAAAWTSSDGLTWEPATVDPQEPGTSMTTVAAVEDGFVAFGTASTTGGPDPDQIAAWHSPDGLTWQRSDVTRAAKSGLGAAVRALTDGPSGPLALAVFFGQDVDSHRLWRSGDGVSWEPTPLPKGESFLWSTILATPDGYLLVGQKLGGRSSNWRSVDGVTWERLADSPRMVDAAAAPDGTVVGIGQNDIWRSSDLETWNSTWTNPRAWDLDGSDAFQWVDWAGDQFAVVGLDFSACAPNTDECATSPLLLSSDGQTWVEAAGPDGLPGPDAATGFYGLAALDSMTVVLGEVGGGPSLAWLVEGDPMATGAAE
jgi:hypothetical protein